MAEDTLNPILNPDCECPEDTPETPTECPIPDPVEIPISVLAEDCNECDEVIVPPPPAVPDLMPTFICLEADSNYQYIPAIDTVPGVGNGHFFYELHPACVRPMQECSFCKENNVCPEDIGLAFRRNDDNIFSVQVEGAEQPLLFWVADEYRERVMSEVGYVKVAQGDMYNEWIPRDCVKRGYLLSPATQFPGGINPFLNPTPKIGTIPTLVLEEPVTSILDPTSPSSSPSSPA
jgi:hypothetical protein